MRKMVTEDGSRKPIVWKIDTRRLKKREKRIQESNFTFGDSSHVTQVLVQESRKVFHSTSLNSWKRIYCNAVEESTYDYKRFVAVTLFFPDWPGNERLICRTFHEESGCVLHRLEEIRVQSWPMSQIRDKKVVFRLENIRFENASRSEPKVGKNEFQKKVSWWLLAIANTIASFTWFGIRV